MKLALLSLIPALLFSNQICTNITNTNDVLNSNERTFNVTFEKDPYFILSETIIEDTSDFEITYQQIDSYFYVSNEDYNIINYSLKTLNSNIFTITKFSYNETLERFDFSLKGVDAGESYLQLDYQNETYTIPVYVNDSFFSFDDATVIKPTSSKEDPLKFDIKLVDGDDISGIRQDEISYEIIENTNSCIKEITFGEIIPAYGIRLQTTENAGVCKIKCSYNYRKGDGTLINVSSFIITINVVEQSKYFTFYELNEKNEYVEILGENPLEVQSFSKKTIYVGNLTANFDPSDFEIKNSSKLGGLVYIELNADYSIDDEYPLLRIDIVPGSEIKSYRISIGIKDTNISKDLVINTTYYQYSIKINSSYLEAHYYVANRPDFYHLSLVNSDFVSLVDENNINLISSYRPTFTQVSSRLGKQRIYVIFNIDDELKYSAFDIRITMDPKYNSDSDIIYDSTKILLYKDFLNYVVNNLPGYYSVEEAYEDLEYEYNNSLDESLRNTLANDFEFIRTYRRFIINNDFDSSFFSEININLGFGRYVAPIVIIVVVILTLGITLAFCFYFVYRKKGKEDD